MRGEQEADLEEDATSLGFFLAFEIEDQNRTNGAQVILKIRVGPFFQINLYVEAQYVQLRKQSFSDGHSECHGLLVPPEPLLPPSSDAVSSP